MSIGSFRNEKQKQSLEIFQKKIKIFTSYELVSSAMKDLNFKWFRDSNKWCTRVLYP
jgi:hypothetical protein